MIAVYLSETDENKIEKMEFPFFENILAMIGRRLNYDAIVNYAGNSNVEKPWTIIEEGNPMNIKRQDANDRSGLAGVFDKMNFGNIEIVKTAPV